MRKGRAESLKVPQDPRHEGPAWLDAVQYACSTSQMLAIFEWASDHPTHPHDIGPLPASKQADQLATRSVIQIRQSMNQYRPKAARSSERGLASYPNQDYYMGDY
jgi:hypothetical protein